MVAPRAGAWIETYEISEYSEYQKSPLAQGRGLKLIILLEKINVQQCRPSRRGVD